MAQLVKRDPVDLGAIERLLEPVGELHRVHLAPALPQGKIEDRVHPRESGGSIDADGLLLPRSLQDRRKHPRWHGLPIRGSLEDSSALSGVLAEIEALGLELLELRQIATGSKSP